MNFLKPTIQLWHASPHEFDEFDFGRIGASNNLKYGWGMYFARSSDEARAHVQLPPARFLYRVDIKASEHRKLLRHSDRLSAHPKHIKTIAERLSAHDPLAKFAERGDLLDAMGQSVYRAACVAAGGGSGVAYEREGALFLANQDVPGASVVEMSGEVVVLYDESMCVIQERRPVR